MKAFLISMILLASGAASAATQCSGMTDRMNLQVEQKGSDVVVLFQMNPKDYNQLHNEKIPGMNISFQEGVSYTVSSAKVEEFVQNKDAMTKLIVNAIFRTAWFAGEEDMAWADAGDLIKALQCR